MKQSMKLGLMMLAVAAVSIGSASAFMGPQNAEVQVNETLGVSDSVGFISDNTPSTESSSIRGEVEVTVTDKATGEIKSYYKSDNAILNDGMEALGALAFGATGSSNGEFEWIEVGTGSTAADAQDTGIETSITNCDRVEADISQQVGTATTAGTVVTVSATIDPSADSDCVSNGISEAVLFDAETGGNAFARNTFTSVDITASDTLDITWTLTFS